MIFLIVTSITASPLFGLRVSSQTQINVRDYSTNTFMQLTEDQELSKQELKRQAGPGVNDHNTKAAETLLTLGDVQLHAQVAYRQHNRAKLPQMISMSQQAQHTPQFVIKSRVGQQAQHAPQVDRLPSNQQVKRQRPYHRWKNPVLWPDPAQAQSRKRPHEGNKSSDSSSRVNFPGQFLRNTCLKKVTEQLCPSPLLQSPVTGKMLPMCTWNRHAGQCVPQRWTQSSEGRVYDLLLEWSAKHTLKVPNAKSGIESIG